MLSHAYNIVIDFVIVAPIHVKDFVDGLNDTDKTFLIILMTSVKLPVADTNNSQLVMHTALSYTDMIEYRIVMRNKGSE